MRTGVKVGTQSLATYSYTQDGYNRLNTLDYGNGDSVEYTYNSDGSLAKQTYEDNAKVTYKYNNDGNLAVVKDTQTGRTTRYYYDLTDRLTKVTESGTDHTFYQTYSYDSSNRLSSSSEVTQGTTRAITYTYDDDNRISVYKKAALSQNFVYDSLGRTKQRIAKNGDTTLLTTTYAFATVDGNATGLVSGMRNRSESSAYNKPYYYTYDDNGNILSFSDGTYTTTYEYDESNQLVRENNQEKGYTHVWIYNSAGNIRFKKEYAYTTSATLGTPNETITYNYDNTNWKDQLTAINSDSFTYDAIGNMLTGGGRTYTWKHGRQLATLTQGGTTWTNTYNADGLRTQRTDGTNTYKYYYSDGKLICIYRNSTRSFFAYTPDGLPYYMTYGGKYYVYSLNLQGDVMAILNDAGEAVVEYTYDAWGNILSITGSMASTVGQFNPLRYRGYVYDNETELYYLQSRYYDPEIGRFINADTFTSTGQGILGNNMYAYCGNNPVVRKDVCGDVWETVFDVISLGASVVEVCINPTDLWAWAGLAGDIVDLIPVATGVGETIRAIKTTSKVVDKTSDVVDAAKTVYKAADASSNIRKATGTYEILYKSGKNYIGKGGFDRAMKSAKAHAGNVDDIGYQVWVRGMLRSGQGA